MEVCIGRLFQGAGRPSFISTINCANRQAKYIHENNNNVVPFVLLAIDTVSFNELYKREFCT